MDIEYQLHKASQEITAGCKAKAVNRLRNLINTYPDDLRAREALGRLYFESGFYDAAGLQWLLCAPSAEKEKCIGIYMNTVNHSAGQVLKDLKYRGNAVLLPAYAQKKLERLRQEAQNTSAKSYRQHLTPPKKEVDSFADKLIKYGCIFVAIFLFIALVHGCASTLRFIKNLF